MLPIAALLSIGEKVLDKVLPDPEARAKAQAMLLEMQQKGELAKLQADMNEQDNLTKRAEADMKSDSWLSKHPAYDADLHPDCLPSPSRDGCYGAGYF